MVVGFRHKGLEAFFRSRSTRGVHPAHAAKLARILATLDVASGPEDLNHPGYKLHPLKGSLKGHWSVWVSANWRVIFRFAGNDVEPLDYLDYH